MQHFFKIISAILMLIIFTACAAKSKFSSESVRLGMTKEEIISKFGKPYKTSFMKGKNAGEFEESLFYRETLSISGNNSITNILTFTNGRLVSLKQGTESGSNTVITPLTPINH